MSARPVFIIGSPRSGTSILTWSLGQHPNLFPTEESNWLDKFALDLASTYAAGTARGRRSQLGSMGVTRNALFAAMGEAIDGVIRGHRTRREELAVAEVEQHPEEVNPAFQLSRTQEEPKARWIDGTPEYSLNVFALRLLFPDARFVHLVRDVDSVAASLMNFSRTGGEQLVQTDREAYAEWLREVRPCLEAERAFGPDVVMRLRYADLVADGPGSIERVLAFLDEPFAEACLEPLATRINSSKVPSGYAPRLGPEDEAFVADARALSARIATGEEPPPDAPDPAALERLELAFAARAEWAFRLLRPGLDPQRLAVSFADERQRSAERAARLGEEPESEPDGLGDGPYARLRLAVLGAVPPGATVAVVSRGDDELLRLEGVRASHFPAGDDGAWLGYHPGDSREAIARLETARESGAEFLLVPEATLWWLDHYDELRRHLDERYTRVPATDGHCAIYALR
jgi:hypothetical protein